MRDDTVADEAKALVFGDRQGSYGHSLDDFGATAKIVSALLKGKLKEDLTAEDVELIMIAVKLSRLSRNMHHIDSLIDIVGYALCLQETQRERFRRGEN